VKNTEGLLPPWQPGQSGNPSGRPKSKPFKEALQKAIAEQGLALAAAALVRKANEGDVPALKELADRLDGKVAQGIVGGDDDDNPVAVVHRIERHIVRPSNQDG